MLPNVLFLLEMHQNCFWHGLPSQRWESLQRFPTPHSRLGVEYPLPITPSTLRRLDLGARFVPPSQYKFLATVYTTARDSSAVKNSVYTPL